MTQSVACAFRFLCNSGWDGLLVTAGAQAVLRCVHTLRVAFSLIWLLAPERSSGKRWSMLMLEVLRRRLSGRLRTPS